METKFPLSDSPTLLSVIGNNGHSFNSVFLNQNVNNWLFQTVDINEACRFCKNPTGLTLRYQ